MNRSTAVAVLAFALAATLGSCGGGGSSTPSPAPIVDPIPATVAFDGSVLLGAPTDASVRISVLSVAQAGSVYASYGRRSGEVDGQTQPLAFSAGTPAVLTLGALAADTRYYYRLHFTGAAIASTPEYTFHTARPAGGSFVFTIQADPHLDENSSRDQYLLTLANVLADQPDFHVDLGDTFMGEKHAGPLSASSPPAASFADVIARYRYERGNFGTATHSVPLFLVIGNHDGEAGWMQNGTPNALPVWATTARKQLFLNPVPDAFYSGDSAIDPLVGQRAAWYAWTWGEALFVALDPFWNSTAQPNQNAWNLTLGTPQYQWLADTLARSTAKFKFVFVHNLVGGLDGQMRGGVEAAPFFEWGGRNLDGSSAFAARRPGWALPIHDLLVRHRVTAVFHGHDHLYARQDLDGIVYQAVPQPSAANTSSGAALASAYHYASGTIASSSGHLRVTVTPTAVTSEYVRAWLPAAQTATHANRAVEDRWVVPAR